MLTKSHKRLEGDVKEYFDLMLNAFEGESERSIGIVSICIIDEQLEKLIRSRLIKNQQASSLFKSEHILQTFYAKTNIAYFFGLIPKWLYDDLRIMGKIRNSFAHKVACNLRFSDPFVLKLINQCKLRLKILDGILKDPTARTHSEMAKTQYILIASRVATYLGLFEYIISKSNLPKPIDFINYDESRIDKDALTKSQFLAAIAKKSKTI